MAKEREFIFKNDVLASNKNNPFGFYSTGTISGKIYFGKTNNSISAYVTVLGEYPNGVVSNIAVVNPSETYLVAKFIPKSKLEPGEHGIRIFDPAGGTVASGLIEFTWKGKRPTSFDHVRYVGPSPDQSISLNAPSHFSSRAAVTTKEVNTVCFVRGTYILTTRGYIQVEHLKLTDFAVTSAGEQHPIKWVGQRTIDCSKYTQSRNVLPIRIAAHAFGPGRPFKELFVSPHHSICVDALGETLIPALSLVNDTTISQIAAKRVSYWHVELEGGHNIVLANGLAAETYLEMGNRCFFVGSTVPRLSPEPDPPVRTHADFCRQFVDSGILLSAVKARLAVQAERLQACEKCNAA